MEPFWQFSAPQVAATRIGLLNNQINKHKHTILTEIATVAGVLNEMKFCWRKHTEKAQNGDMVLLTITHQNTKTFTVFFSQQPRPKISYESALDEKKTIFFSFLSQWYVCQLFCTNETQKRYLGYNSLNSKFSQLEEYVRPRTYFVAVPYTSCNEKLSSELRKRPSIADHPL